MRENEIKTTTNYTIFKRLEGNREITRSRESAILSSIRENGYVGAPILVNSEMEVIDGQGRLSACETLGIPIPYCMKSDADIKTCMILNQNTRNWKDEDYVKSYVEQGNENFKKLLYLMEKYDLGVQTVVFAIKGHQHGGGSNSPIRRGSFKVNDEEYKKADAILEKLMPLLPFIKRAKAHTQKLSFAIMYAIGNPSVDYERLRDVLSKKYHEIEPYSVLEDLLDEISKRYNYGLKGSTQRIYLKTDYEKEKYCEL